MDKQIPRIGIGIFVFKKGKFLMGKRSGAHGEGTWSVPGGNLDFGETIEQGAYRETLEETGVKVSNAKVMGFTNDIFRSDNKHYITFWVASNWKSGAPKITEPDKFLGLDWFDFNHLPRNLFLPWKQLLKSEFISEIKKLAK